MREQPTFDKNFEDNASGNKCRQKANFTYWFESHIKIFKLFRNWEAFIVALILYEVPHIRNTKLFYEIFFYFKSIGWNTMHNSITFQYFKLSNIIFCCYLISTPAYYMIILLVIKVIFLQLNLIIMWNLEYLYWLTVWVVWPNNIISCVSCHPKNNIFVFKSIKKTVMESRVLD